MTFLGLDEIDAKIAEAERTQEAELDRRRGARPGRFYAGDGARLAAAGRALVWLRAEREKLLCAGEREAAGVHLCHAIGCTRKVAPRFLMCGRHWQFVPPELQRRVYATYRAGQEHRKDPSREYVAAARDAISAAADEQARLAQQRDEHP